ncbi:hypothetical protein [Nonomuraea sp. NPDC023979]
MTKALAVALVMLGSLAAAAGVVFATPEPVKAGSPSPCHAPP